MLGVTLESTARPGRSRKGVRQVFNRCALWLVTVLGIASVFGFALPAAAQGQGVYYWAGATAQGDWLELTATPGSAAWTVTEVRLSGAVVKCGRSTEDLDLSAFVFATSAQIGSAPFTMARLTAGDGQVALLIKGQATGGTQLDVTLTVYWSRLHYATARDIVPAGERCSAVVPVTLQLFAVD
jgi:hypothetical protein